MNVVQYECQNCGHLTKMILQERDYRPDIFCPKALCRNGVMKRWVLSYVIGKSRDPRFAVSED